MKKLPANTGDVGSIPGSGRSLGGGNGNPLQYPCLGKPTDRGTWQATVHRVPKSQTQQQLNNNNTFAHLIDSFFKFSRKKRRGEHRKQNISNIDTDRTKLRYSDGLLFSLCSICTTDFLKNRYNYAVHSFVTFPPLRCIFIY